MKHVVHALGDEEDRERTEGERDVDHSYRSLGAVAQSLENSKGNDGERDTGRREQNEMQTALEGRRDESHGDSVSKNRSVIPRVSVPLLAVRHRRTVA
jgi:hypothetical protein